MFRCKEKIPYHETIILLDRVMGQLFKLISKLLPRKWRREKGGLADSCTGVEQTLFPNESTALPKKRKATLRER